MASDLALAVRSTGRRPSHVVASVTSRKAARSGLLWGCGFGLYLAVQAFTYASTYTTASSRAQLVHEFGSNPGIAAIAGPARVINTVAGYTVWKCLAVLAVVGAVWGLSTATRLLRGEEESGRWELLVTGQTTRRAATGQALVGLGAGLTAMWVGTAVVLVLVGRSAKVGFSAGDAMFFALAVVSGAAMFLAVGALTSQLAATRRQASAYAAAGLGVSYGLRMVADSGVGLSWLRWVSPLGWIEELRPLTSPRLWVVLPIAALTIVMSGFAVHLAGKRGVGDSIVADRASGPPRLRLLFGPAGLMVRLARPALVGWGVGLCAIGLLLGFVAKSAGSAMTQSPSLRKALARLGGQGNGPAAYLGVAFLIVAVVLAVVAAGQISAMRGEELEGRVDNVLARPYARSVWFGQRLLFATLAALLGGLLAGFATWVAAVSQQAGVAFTSLAAAGVNAAAPAICVLGAGALVFGMRPRSASVVTYGFLAFSFLVQLIGDIAGVNHWVLDLSVFHHAAAAPAVAVNRTADGVLAVVGVIAAAVGAVAFTHRDLATE